MADQSGEIIRSLAEPRIIEQFMHCNEKPTWSSDKDKHGGLHQKQKSGLSDGPADKFLIVGIGTRRDRLKVKILSLWPEDCTA